MHDEIDGRLWVSHGKAFGEQMSQLFNQLLASSKVAVRISYAAPWRRSQKASCR